ncbi:MAG: beta-lactamase family protein [Planctomycetes bacterium]|nr:beta-lactamase family protein [Planctomycetota bacterium]
MRALAALTGLVLALAPAQDPAGPTPEAAAPAPSAAIDVAALLEPIRARHGLPGLAAAIVDRQGAAAVGACGVRERGREQPLTSDDRLHLGSCTKAMTATLCARLVRAGQLAWDTPIGSAFSDWGEAVHAGWRDATLEQLLAHRAGAPRDVEPELWARLCASQDSPRAQREALVRATLAAPPAHAPGTQFEYSNTGTTIAGVMAERAAGVDFEALLAREIFGPLGMGRAGFGPPGTAGAHDEPVGHRANGQPVGLGNGADNPPAIAPAGRVHASLGDWARFAALHLRGPTAGGLGLEPADFARLHAPLVDDASHYALGWIAAERSWGGRVITHAGSNTLWYCVAWLAPERGFGVLVATNQGGDAARAACDEAAAALIGAWTRRTGSTK